MSNASAYDLQIEGGLMDYCQPTKGAALNERNTHHIDDSQLQSKIKHAEE